MPEKPEGNQLSSPNQHFTHDLIAIVTVAGCSPEVDPSREVDWLLVAIVFETHLLQTLLPTLSVTKRDVHCKNVA